MKDLFLKPTCDLNPKDGIMQSVGDITASTVFGVNCVYNLQFGSSDPATVAAVLNLCHEYRALRMAVCALTSRLNILEKETKRQRR